MHIINEWQHFNTRDGSLRDLFLTFIIIKLCKRVEVIMEDHNTLEECDVEFNPLKVKSSW